MKTRYQARSEEGGEKKKGVQNRKSNKSKQATNSIHTCWCNYK